MVLKKVSSAVREVHDRQGVEELNTQNKYLRRD